MKTVQKRTGVNLELVERALPPAHQAAVKEAFEKLADAMDECLSRTDDLAESFNHAIESFGYDSGSADEHAFFWSGALKTLARRYNGDL